MTDINEKLNKEDYSEQACPLCMKPELSDGAEHFAPIPTARVIEKLDEHLSRNDTDAAMRHLNYWLNEADSANDKRGKLTIVNELMGLNRKLGNKDDAYRYAENALSLIDELEMCDTLSAAMTWINAATVYKAFGEAEKALPYYEKAKAEYDKSLDKSDMRYSGLCNNMALALADLKRYEEAEKLYNTALEILSACENGQLDMAITYLNLATLYEERDGMENAETEIEKMCGLAEKCINTPTLKRDGYYAYVCEKCASVFGYYGYFLYEKELNKRAKEIYERA